MVVEVFVCVMSQDVFKCKYTSFLCGTFMCCCFTVPLLSRVCPSDVCRIWKSGASLRVDATLLGFENMTWIRGRRSYIFRGDGVCSNTVLSLVICSFSVVIEVCAWLCFHRLVCRIDGGESRRWSSGHWTLQHIPRNRGCHTRVDAASWTGSCQTVDYTYCQHLLRHQGYCFWEARVTSFSHNVQNFNFL